MEKPCINPTFHSKKAILALGFLFFFYIGLNGQNKILADSLELIYNSGDYDKKDEMELLKKLTFNHPKPQPGLYYANELLKLALPTDSVKYIISGYLHAGNSLKLMGELSKALDNYFQAAEVAIENDKTLDLGVLYVAIANTYSVMENEYNTIKYYKNAIKILKELNDTISYASALENLGDEYSLNFGKPDSALIFFKESGQLFRALDYEIGIAYNMGNVGLANAQLGNNQQAEKNITEAVEILTKLGDYYPISVYLLYMADIYAEQDDWDSAFDYAQMSLDLAKDYGLKEQIGDAHLKLSELYEKSGNAEEALFHYKDHATYNDSIKNIALVQEMANLRTNFEVSQKQVEVDLLNQQKRNQLIILGFTGVLLFALFYFYLTISRQKKISENLLLNILPSEIAEELKVNGQVAATRYNEVSVLFTDFKEFTNHSENLAPEELVNSVDFYFSRFDQIMEKHGLEKIKTIGDSYMCVGGLPFVTEDHAHKILEAALEIGEFVRVAKKENAENHPRFDVRIGINSGPVVAGVVGIKKFAYDIWGDTVNIASRMESMSDPGRINISQSTYELVKDDFDCEYRGEIEVRNRGLMKMYFVNGQINNGENGKSI